MRVRRIKEINADLGVKAIVDGFIPKPIYTYINVMARSAHKRDDLNDQTCDYNVESLNYRVKKDSSYEGHLHLVESLNKPM